MINRSLVHTILLGFMSTVGLCSVGALTTMYYMIKKFTGRPVYSIIRQQEHEKNRALLLHDFHARPLNFSTLDGIRLSGLLLARDGAQRNVLVCHGYRMSKERMFIFASMFPDDNILLFDYRAHGESDGNRTTIGYNEKKDVLAAVNVLKTHEKTKDLPIFAIGISMGAVSLLAAACECEGIKGLVLDSPFLRLDEQAQRTMTKRYKLPMFPFAILGRFIFEYLMQFSLAEVNSLVWAEQIKIPIFIIHSMKDDTAPSTDAKMIYEKVATSKDLWLVDQSGHARIFNDCSTEYQQRVDKFFNTVA